MNKVVPTPFSIRFQATTPERTMTNTEKLEVRLPAQLNERLEDYKEETGLTKSEVTRSALMDELGVAP